MPNLLDAGELTLQAILAERQDELVIHLLTADPLLQDVPELDQLPHARFPGYRPAERLKWQEASVDPDPASPWIKTRAQFVAGAITQVSELHGYAVAWQPPDGTPQGLSFGRIAPPIVVGSERQAVALTIELQLHTVGLQGQEFAVIMSFSRAESWTGGQPLRRVTGTERALLNQLSANLERALARDSLLGDMSRRSNRSQVPLIPLGDTELLAGVSALRARLRLLLSA